MPAGLWASDASCPAVKACSHRTHNLLDVLIAVDAAQLLQVL